MVQRIEEICPDLKAAAFLGPIYRDVTHDAHVDIELARTVHNSRRAVAEGGAYAIRTDYEGRCETRLVEIIA